MMRNRGFRYYKLIERSLFLIVWLSIYSQRAEAQDKFSLQISAGLYANNHQAWSIEPSFTYSFCKFVGITAGIELTSQYLRPAEIIKVNGRTAVLNNSNVGWISLIPSLHLITPSIWSSKDNSHRLWFEISPGIRLGCPFHDSMTFNVKNTIEGYGPTIDTITYNNHDLKWFYWNTEAMFKYSIDRFNIGIGYAISDFDYYAGIRNVKLPNQQQINIPKKEYSHLIYLSLGYVIR